VIAYTGGNGGLYLTNLATGTVTSNPDDPHWSADLHIVSWTQ
jgi:hypothetical protein